MYTVGSTSSPYYVVTGDQLVLGSNFLAQYAVILDSVKSSIGFVPMSSSSGKIYNPNNVPLMVQEILHQGGNDAALSNGREIGKKSIFVFAVSAIIGISIAIGVFLLFKLLKKRSEAKKVAIRQVETVDTKHELGKKEFEQLEDEPQSPVA